MKIVEKTEPEFNFAYSTDSLWDENALNFKNKIGNETKFIR